MNMNERRLGRSKKRGGGGVEEEGKRGEVVRQIWTCRLRTVRCRLCLVPWAPKKNSFKNAIFKLQNNYSSSPPHERKSCHLQMINLPPAGTFWYAQCNIHRRQTVRSNLAGNSSSSWMGGSGILPWSHKNRNPTNKSSLQRRRRKQLHVWFNDKPRVE